MHCGFAEVIITPVLGSPIPGAGRERISEGIKDHLYAKAFVWEDGETAAAMLAIDAIDLARREVERIRARVAKLTTIRAEQVTVCTTHAHTAGPTIRTSYVNAVDEEYLAHMVDKSADAVVLAFDNRVEAQVGYGLGYEDGISFQRRFHMNDGSVRTNPGVGNPDIVQPAGPIDPDVAVLRVDDLAGRPLGIITNFACHPDVVGGLEYSGDYPGELSRVLKKVYGEQVVSLFLQGTSGNINHVDVSEQMAFERDSHYKKMGRILAGEVIKVREKIVPRSELRLRIQRAFVPVQFRLPTETELAEAHQLLQSDGAVNPLALNFAGQRVQLAERGPEQADAEIQAWAFGEGGMSMVFLPAEIFVEFGLAIKEASPFPFTIVTELANGSVSGYVCTPAAFEQGGYEPQLREYSRLQVEAGDLFVQQALQLLSDMK